MVGKSIVASQNEKFEPSNPDIKTQKDMMINSNEPADLTLQQSDWITGDALEIKNGLMKTEVKEVQLTELQSNELIASQIPLIKILTTKKVQARGKSLQAWQHQSISSTIGIDIEVPGNRVVEPPNFFRGGISDLIVYEGSKLLKKFPKLNSSYINTKTIGLYEKINFGWSFYDGENLKVLTIKGSDQLSLIEIQGEVGRLLDINESNKNISMDALSASTITISDLSETKASFVLPRISGPQSMALGVVRRSINNFSLFATFDYRVSEDTDVTNFLTELKLRIFSHFLDGNGMAPIVCHVCEKSIAEEIALRHKGFIKITLANGKDTNICRNCFDGW